MSARALSAAQIQPPDDAARMIAERGEAGVARSLQVAFAALTDTFDLTTLAADLAANRFTALWRHLALERLGSALRPALNRLAVLHDQSAHAASLSVATAPLIKARPRFVRTPAVINLTYDPLNPATVAAQNATNDALTATLEAQAQASAEAILSDGLTRGLAAATIARRLREALGMSPAEANAVQAFRAALESGTGSPLARVLRDRRYDARVRRGDLSPDQIDRMSTRYAERYRAFRAQRIARTESLRAANQGRLAAWRQYSAASGRDVRRFWLTAGDELVCLICAPIPAMNPDGIGLDARYATPIGPLNGPPDPHPLCRCTEHFARLASAAGGQGATTSGVGFRIELDYGQ